MYKPNLIPFAKRSFAIALFCTFSSCAFSATSAQTNESVEAVQEAQEPSEHSTISNDFLLPVTAKSKNQSLDGKKKTSIFMDNVIIRQGSLEILADQVVADATAGKGKEIITATGNPASYQQRLEDGSVVSASANEIQYKVEFQTISLKGNAAIKQNDVQVNGDSIAFDMGKEQIMASTDANSDATVTTVLSPGAFSSGEKDATDDEDKP
ncbi:MAG: lipopolysaccharide export system protein LptA [Alphaproteobacteria bacterium]|jgi:lipopolysaccharide export system protein LptA